MGVTVFIKNNLNTAFIDFNADVRHGEFRFNSVLVSRFWGKNTLKYDEI